MSEKTRTYKTLRDWRVEKGLTLAEVAAALGCAVSGPGSWERGRYGPSPRQIPRLATVLGITPEEVRKAADSSRRRKMPVRHRARRVGRTGQTMSPAPVPAQAALEALGGRGVGSEGAGWRERGAIEE